MTQILPCGFYVEKPRLAETIGLRFDPKGVILVP